MPAPTEAYPRNGGVVVPAGLVFAGAPSGADAATTVEWFRRSRHRLPDELLASSFPSPREILAAWRLGTRTQRLLAEIDLAEGSWSLRDFLRRPGMGPSTILDLLAAREENAPAAGAEVRTADARAIACFALEGRLAEVSAFMRAHLPVPAAGIGALLVNAGFLASPPTIDELARMYRDRGLPAPFRVVRRLGGAVAVQPDALAAVEALFGAAAYFVVRWGVCTLDAAMARLRSLSVRDMSLRAAARILGALPGLRWLDERAGWFSFAGHTGRVGRAIRKIFGVFERVSLEDLVAAVGKSVKVFAAAPLAAVQAYLVDVVGCEIDSGLVRLRAGFVSAIDPRERAIVRMIHRLDGDLTIQSRRAMAAAVGVPLRVINDFVRTSPIVIANGRRLRLTGIPRASEPVGPPLDGHAQLPRHASHGWSHRLHAEGRPVHSGG
jgi:hypothetical protein